MSKIHYFQRYSSVENTVTNNTLQLIARIYTYSTSKVSQLLSELTGEDVYIGIEINQQRKEISSIPDGAITQRSFKILIESKVDAAVDLDQLASHAEAFSSEDQKVLLLLTKAPLSESDFIRFRDKLKKHGSGLIFKNITYEAICEALAGLFDDHETDIKDIAEDYIEYCHDAELVDHSNHRMRIVPCGQSMPINQRYGIYFQPSDRGYAPHRFIGIYKDKSVRCIWEIDSVFDIEITNQGMRKTFVQGRETNDYDDRLREMIRESKEKYGFEVETGHRFFCGRPFETDYRKASKHGLRGARFINLLDEVGEFDDAEELAEKLTGSEWH